MRITKARRSWDIEHLCQIVHGRIWVGTTHTFDKCRYCIVVVITILVTILFIDEIHRFNKGQQDYLLPFVEDGTILFIGATTENPYFEVNGARSEPRILLINADIVS